MVSEETESNLRGSRPYIGLDYFDNLENEIALLRDCIENLIVSNRDLHQEVRELNSELSLINIHLDRTPTGHEGEEDQDEVQLIEAQPVEQADRPLQIGDRVRITSRQQFGVVGEIHSFTNQRVRILVEGRRRPLIRSANNLQRIQ